MDLKFPIEIDSTGEVETVELVEETAQRAKIALKSQQGEWDYDISFGVPWRQIMSTRPYELGAARGFIVQQLRKVPGLDSITSVVLTPDDGTRELDALVTVVASGVTVEVSS